MPDREREIVMPVPTSEAALQFFTEALRANTKVLEGVQETGRELAKEVREMRDIVIEQRAQNYGQRLDSLAGKNEKLSERVDTLETARDQQVGATTALGTLWKNLPSIAAFIVGIAVIAFLFAKATGRVS